MGPFCRIGGAAPLSWALCWVSAALLVALGHRTASAEASAGSYYEALGVTPGAGAGELKAAFEARSSASGGALAAAREAFDALSHAAKRRRYDALEADVQQRLGGGPGSRAATAPAAAVAAAAGGAWKNLARGRPTWQSSTRQGGGDPERAVDGVADPQWASGSCSHTDPAGEASPWWSVDLGFPKAIGKVRLLNRLEAGERLRRWRIFAGTSPGGAHTDPSKWLGVAPCGPEGAGFAPAGGWVEVDCGGVLAQHIGVVLNGGPGGREILTLCEVEVLEQAPPARRPLQPAAPGATGDAGLFSAAKRYVEEYLHNMGAPWNERRLLYLQRAADLLGEALDGIADDDVVGLERFYKEASDLPVSMTARARSSATIPSATSPLLLVRARALERLALSEACVKDAAGCCPPALTRSAAGCLATALALAKLAGPAGARAAGALFETALEGRPGDGRGVAPRGPFIFWPAFRQTCELYVPDLGRGSTTSGPFLDPNDPALQPLASTLAGAPAVAALRADVEMLEQQRRGEGVFEPAYPALVEEGGWDRVVLYDGVRGWDPRWCGPEASPRLQLCDVLSGKLPGEASLLQKYYLLDNNEEVSISRLAAHRTALRPHSGGTNARLNMDLALPGRGRTSLRVGGQWRSFGSSGPSAAPAGTLRPSAAPSAAPGASLFVYDACQDREVTHEGDGPFYFLQVGIMHPDLVIDLMTRRSRGEL